MKIAGVHSIAEWHGFLQDPGSALYEKLTSIYGSRDSLEAPLTLLRRVIEEFGCSYGRDRSVFAVRSTGRVNLLGMHIDHRGGSVNPIAIKEAFFAVEPREDDKVVLRDIQGEEYPEESFVIGECLPKGSKIADWDAWCHDELEKRKDDPSITYSNYVRSSVLYFQHLYTDERGKFTPPFKGMNVMIGSNIPPAAGLSTSSCNVVASGVAALHINGIRMDPMEFCEHCGFAEWYVGTRGGFGDHAAIRLGRCNMIAHMTGFPFSLQFVPFPDGYRVVLADSQVEAKKQAGARDGFNTPVASYIFGLLLARKNWPQYAAKMERLRDINPNTLDVSDAEILRIIRSLPESATRQDLIAMMPEKQEEMKNIFRSHNEPRNGYKIRRVCMFGVAECMRADLVIDLLKANDIEGFGRLMTLHHDGDRVARLQRGKMMPEQKDYSDARMDRLIAETGSGDHRPTEQARVWTQPGGYNVSVPELDMLVDVSLGLDGVVGAELVGAGLGGSMVALVRSDRAEALVEHLADDYYKPRGLPAKAEIVAPVGGADIIDI